MKRFKSLLSLLLVLVMMLSLAVPALAAANEISVTVVDTNGAPVSGATVSLRENVHTGAGDYANGPQEIATGVTDANGQYTFTGIVTSGEHEHSKWSVACNGVVSGDIDATGVNSGRDVTVTIAAPQPQTYSVTYNGNGGKTQWGTASYSHEPAGQLSGEIELYGNKFEREGYQFLGWSEDRTVTEPEYRNYGKINVTDNITLYAVWEIRTDLSYTVHYEHKVTGDKIQQSRTVGNQTYGDVIPGNEIVADNQIPGYTVAGASAGSVTIGTGTNEITLFYTPISYTVKFDSNGGTGYMADQTLTYDESTALSPNVFTRDGYEFQGWAVSKTVADNGVVSYGDGATVKNLANEEGRIVRLYAVWEEATYSFNVTYHINYDELSSTAKTPVTNKRAEDVVTLKGEETFTRDGYKLIGWSTDDGANVTVDYALGETVTVEELLTLVSAGNKDVHLYAVWEEAIPAPVKSDLTGLLKAKFVCDENVDGHGETIVLRQDQYGFAVASQNDAAAVVTVTVLGSKLTTDAYHKIVTTGEGWKNGNKSFNVTLSWNGTAWELAAGEAATVVIELECLIPAPVKSDLTGLLKAKLDCDKDHGQIVTLAQNQYADVRVVSRRDEQATISANVLCANLTPVANHSWKAEKVPFTVTLNWNGTAWELADPYSAYQVLVEMICLAPEKPTDAQVKALIPTVIVDCVNDVMQHADQEVALKDGSYTIGKVAEQDGSYYCTITVDTTKYVPDAKHELVKESAIDVTLIFDTNEQKWERISPTLLKIEVVCETPDKPAVTFAKLAELIDVKIDCVDPRNNHPDYTSELLADTYTLSALVGDPVNGYTTTLTLKADEYVKAYNAKVAKNHVLERNETAKTVNLKATYDESTEKWTWALNGSVGTVTIKVEQGYTVTYQWKGDAPFGVEPPVDNTLYKKGDIATVVAAPKDAVWGCKGGEWKWDRVNERWYWSGCGHRNHYHTYWYADKVDGQIGYWVFTGWERQVWVDGNRWQKGYWKTETLKPGQKITVNDDVVIYGTWEFKAAAGTVVLSKTVKGLDTDSSFTFEIYNANDTKKPYKVVKLEDGDRTYVSLPNGTYYITELDAEVKGYDLVVTVDGDIDADGGKFTIKGDAKVISYTNTYKPEGPALNKEDHIAYLNGYADGTVKPNANITREEVATIFYRLLTEESRERYATSSNSFTDVKATRWSNVAISTLANAGIINGYPDGSFKPAGYITRGEMANIISKFAELTGGRTTFTDISNHWAAAAIRSAAANGWINGYKDGSFKPNQFITRAETVSMINRVLERNPDTVGDLLDGMKTFTDNMVTTKWYYFAIQEAANGHSYSRDPYGNESWTKLN